MIRLLVAGLWICVVTLAAAYAAVSFNAATPEVDEPDEFFGGLDYAKTEIISVPVIDEGAVKGYVIAQFVYTIDANTKKNLSVPPDVFILDSAFRTIYEDATPDFENLEKEDLGALTTAVKEAVNKRFQADIIEDVLVEIFNFVPKNSIRLNSLGQPEN